MLGQPQVIGWNTDWSNRTIDLSELIKGRPELDPRDIIRPIDEPKFGTVEEASKWLEGREPVALLEFAGEARAYPLRILTIHEVVNDLVGDVPIAVTYCPLCNSGLYRFLQAEHVPSVLPLVVAVPELPYVAVHPLVPATPGRLQPLSMGAAAVLSYDGARYHVIRRRGIEAVEINEHVEQAVIFERLGLLVQHPPLPAPLVRLDLDAH